MFLLVVNLLCRLSERPFGALIQQRLSRLMAIFAAVVLYFTAVQHLTNLYAAEHSGVEAFILAGGGIYSTLFWLVQVVLGGLVPIALILAPQTAKAGSTPIIASLLIVLGGFAQLYVIVIGGQAYPMEIFPGYEVSSSFYDGAVNSYSPSLWELLLGLGGVALALMAAGIGAKILRVLPSNLSDANLGQQS